MAELLGVTAFLAKLDAVPATQWSRWHDRMRDHYTRRRDKLSGKLYGNGVG
jgi:hypothetical protein